MYSEAKEWAADAQKTIWPYEENGMGIAFYWLGQTKFKVPRSPFLREWGRALLCWKEC